MLPSVSLPLSALTAQIEEILRKLRALIVEAGSAVIASRSRALTLPLSSRYSSSSSAARPAARVPSLSSQAPQDQPAFSAAEKVCAVGVGVIGGSDRGGDSVWGPTTAEVHR